MKTTFTKTTFAPSGGRTATVCPTPPQGAQDISLIGDQGSQLGLTGVIKGIVTPWKMVDDLEGGEDTHLAEEVIEFGGGRELHPIIVPPSASKVTGGSAAIIGDAFDSKRQ